ncbi:MAG: glycosyltransferase family 2 protein [Planctomycetia bacterium]|nr:glycosyltransferase family 2 protein [Planctomycetia bacterium]
MTPTRPPTLTVVVPVFNEKDTVREILRRVRASPVDKEIVVVDDGSTDGTRELLAAETGDDLRVILHEQNRGKGAALHTGFAAARGDVVIVQDADLEYDPAEFPALLAPILDGRADAVFGSRFLSGPHRVLYFRHRLGNGLLTFLSNLATNLNLTDMETCYKAVRRPLLQALPLVEKRFGFEPEVTAKLARTGARIYEVPCSYSGRTYEEGKKIGWKDGVRALWCIWKYGVLRR